MASEEAGFPKDIEEQLSHEGAESSEMTLLAQRLFELDVELTRFDVRDDGVAVAVWASHHGAVAVPEMCRTEDDLPLLSALHRIASTFSSEDMEEKALDRFRAWFTAQGYELRFTEGVKGGWYGAPYTPNGAVFGNAQYGSGASKLEAASDAAQKLERELGSTR